MKRPKCVICEEEPASLFVQVVRPFASGWGEEDVLSNGYKEISGWKVCKYCADELNFRELKNVRRKK